MTNVMLTIRAIDKVTPALERLRRRSYQSRIVTPIWACRREDRVEVALNRASFALRDFGAVYKQLTSR